jgi:L-ribulose-5-phosphate 3-epimerase UlaE
MTAMDLQHGCRTEYGPLELRIQTTDQLNRFMVYVEDSRREPICVYEQAVQSTLESAQEYLVLRAVEYLDSYKEAAEHNTDWRCS